MARRTYLLALAAAAGWTTPALAIRDSQGFFDDFKSFNGSRWFISDGWVNGDWQDCSWTRRNVALKNGILRLSLTPTKSRLRGYQCGELQSRSRLGYGTFEARMKAAEGSGIISAAFTYSGPPHTGVHDELDFEVLGRAPGEVQTNFFVNGKGNRSKEYQIGDGKRAGFVTYAVEWLPSGLRWFVDGKLVRTDKSGALPTTAGKMFLSIWNAAPNKQDWAGKTNPKSLPATAEFDWVGFTPAGKSCLFPQSITCRR